MSTRTIITSQPDVACYVCERRLLRGEQPEVFLVDGGPRTVCELCVPRAAHEGWLREADSESVSLPPLRSRRGRNLFGRLRQMGRPADAQPEVGATSPFSDHDPEPYDFLGGATAVAADPGMAEDRSAEYRSAAAPVQPTRRSAPSGPPVRAIAADPVRAITADPVRAVAAEPGTARADDLLERAIEAFNAGEYPRRVAGVARSLGAPGVSVRSLEDGASAVVIVVAWGLCWYRYEVDLDGEGDEVRILAQGTELEELPPEDRRGNAVADDFGALSLVGAHA
jgi:hypothetical protein